MFKINVKKHKSILEDPLIEDFWDKLTSFWVTLLAVLLVVSIVFGLFLYYLPKYLEFNASYIESVSSIVSLILGLPIAFSASWVAIILAQRSYRVSKRQAESEVKTRLDDLRRSDSIRIDEVIDDISNRITSAYDSYRSFSSATASVAAHYLSSSQGTETFVNDQLFQSKLTELYVCQRKFVASLVLLSTHPITRRLFNRFENLNKICGRFEDDASIAEFSFTSGDVKSLQAAIELISSCPNPQAVEKILISFFTPQTYTTFEDEEFEDDASYAPISEILSPTSLILLSGLILSEDKNPIWIDTSGDERELDGWDSINLGGVFILDFLLQYPFTENHTQFLVENIKQHLGVLDELDDYLTNRIEVCELLSVKSDVQHYTALYMKSDDVFEILFVDSCAPFGDYGKFITDSQFEFYINEIESKRFS